MGEDHIEEIIRDTGPENFQQSPVYESLCNDGVKPLYPGCTNYTRLSAVLKLFNLKARNSLTDKCFTELLELMKDMLPEENTLPKRNYEAKKILCPMGMEYKKIHACPNDCILYRKEFVDLEKCPTCCVSRYKKKDDDSDETSKRGPPAKVLWYLPIIPRLKRLFANAKDAKNLRWHADERKCDGFIRHPADSLQWKKIDNFFPEFGNESRNLRFGLANDGMNPYGNLSSNHSSWPVFLVIYNLPPSLCMKRKYIMLSMMISGPRQPGNDIDVYLRPLIEELKTLWEEGVDVFDGFANENFRLRAMLFCTINDFPAYGNLSGYCVKGHKARKDLVEMGIRKELALDCRGKRTYLPTACHNLSKKEKQSLCDCLSGTKVPHGYSSNIKKLVSTTDLKLVVLKSHDCHVLMQQLLPVAIRGILPKKVRNVITRLCLFFKAICNKVIDPRNFDELEHEVTVILCQLEMFFPQSFFDIMVHLIVHLVREIRWCGPVFLRWMYPIE